MSLVTPALALFVATFASEDLACITAGLLIQRGEIGVTAGIVACTAGIFVGDVGLWAVGRLFGRASLEWRWVARLRGRHAMRQLQIGITRHAAGAIVGSRFLPGTRLPLYVLSGVLKVPATVFSLWALIAALLWTPTVILLTATLGDAFVARVAPVIGIGWMARLAAALSVLAMLRVGRSVASPEQRIRMAACVARWRRWEFWPMWLFYGPVAAWIAWLALRYRGIATMTAANPGMADGGTVGESKAAILATLPPEATIRWALIPPGEAAARFDMLEAHRATAGWSFPLILKPDVGQRGVGVKRVHDEAAARHYLQIVNEAIVAQPYHDGPFEAGVFYYRFPHWRHGRILSITDKRFPIVEGDGVSTLEALIWRHPRLRLQAGTFIERHRDALDRVLERGERLQLAVAGNHAQGTTFYDGTHLLTPALEARIDSIAQRVDGFFVGRFDIRYTGVDGFRAGTDLAIVELNGATSESTNIYDPATSLRAAYRQLFRQWSIVFQIGAANRRRGVKTTPLARLVKLVRAHMTARPAFQVSD